MSKEKLIICFTVLIDVIGMGIVIPILPFYVQEFSASSFAVTSLFAVFSFFAFFSSPLMGMISDRFGRRPSLIISITSSAVGWFIFASANSLPLLFLGRIIDGLAAGNFTTAQSYLADLAKDEKERTANMGLIGAIFGIGFIIGPIIGAALGQISHVLPFWVVAILATLNAIAALKFLPETHHDRHKDKINLNPFGPIIKAFKDSVLRSRYIAFFFFGLAFASMQTIFALFVGDEFGFGARETGIMFAGMGLVMAINQGFLLSKFWLKYFKESFLEKWLFLIFALAFVFLGSGNLALFFTGMLLNGLTQTVIRAIISSRVAGLAGPKYRGEAMGVMSSIISLAMIIAPLLAGVLYENNHAWPFWFGIMCLFAAFFVINFCCRPVVRENLIDAENPQIVENL